ncbi:hypothetical protein MUN89_05180 [Halobacillus salinarum]|uniref:Uncharacterized protein n=1 Tax=Halobacillus salinarum TaxID=2932257 RepID=A0ABY4EN11_9BACI|nr:hypothetical protein [Halobacillus salinarum]UOQ45342.1 hypothetical protein MUN89_05180 [Halobacillus salinarum]
MFIKKAGKEKYELQSEDRQVGTFKIMQVGHGIGKIKQLEVVNGISPGDILRIFELIQTYAQTEKFNELHVESHSSTLDHLLKHQRFQLHDSERRLWIYKVTHR